MEYQPVLQLARHEIVSVEALLRWDHPERWDGQYPLSRLGMAVNLSPRQLLDADLVARVAQILDRSGPEPDHPGRHRVRTQR